jgi:putative membrane protein
MIGHGFMGPGFYGGGYWLGGFIGMLLIAAALACIVFLVVWLVRQMPRKPGEGEDESAIDILKRRYARGEISREEYERMKKDIL